MTIYRKQNYQHKGLSSLKSNSDLSKGIGEGMIQHCVLVETISFPKLTHIIFFIKQGQNCRGKYNYI